MRKEPILICPRFYIASEVVAATKEKLLFHNISTLVNAGFPNTDSHYKNDCSLEYVTFELREPEFKEQTKEIDVKIGEEVEEKPLAERLPPLFEYLDEKFDSGASIVVYCKGGSKSSVLAMGYIMYKYSCSCREAYQYIQSRDSFVKPNLIFVKDLLDFETQFLGISTEKGDQESFVRVLPPNLVDPLPDQSFLDLFDTCISLLIQLESDEPKPSDLLIVMQKIDSSDLLQAQSRKRIFNVVKEKIDSLVHELIQKLINNNNEAKNNNDHEISKKTNSKNNNNKTATKNNNIPKIDDKECYDGVIKMINDFREFILRVNQNCQFLLGLNGIISYSFSLFFSGEKSNQLVIIFSQFLLYLMKIELDDTFKDTTLNFYFQIMEKITDRYLLNLFQDHFIAQFASYVHKNIGYEESKNHCVSRLSMLPNLIQISTKIKEMVQDSFTDTYSWTLTDANNKNNSINSYKVTSFDASKWPKEYLLGRNNNNMKEMNAFESVNNVNLPTSLAMAFENYKNYISQNYTNMSVKLLPHLGTGELLYKVPNSEVKVTIIATTLQIILLETIENEELSFEDIKNHTNINLVDLMSAIKSLLLKPKNCSSSILLRKLFKPEVSSNIHKNDLFKVNPNFKPNSKTVDLTK